MNDKFMKTLYEWSISQSSGLPEDQASAKVISKEDQEWLLNALKANFTDGATLLKICFNALDQLEDEQKVQTFETLEDLLENIDNARILTPMKKWPVLIRYLKSENEGLRHAVQKAAGAAVNSCAEVIADAIDNGIQDCLVVEKTCFPLVSALIKDDNGIRYLPKGLLFQFSQLEGCKQRADFLNQLLRDKIELEQVPEEVKQAWKNQLYGK